MKTNKQKKEEKLISVPREWFDRLNNIFQNYEEAQGEDRTHFLNVTLGYLASVETILQIKNK